MQKRFLVNLLFLLALNLLIKPFYIFGIDVQVQNIVGSEDYGFYFSLFNFSFLFNMFLDIGVTNYNTKNTAQSPKAIHKYIGSFFGLKIVLAGFYIVLTLVVALVLGYKGKELHILYFFIFNQILISLIQYIRSNFAGLHLFKIDAILSVMDRFILILIAGTVIYTRLIQASFQIEWFVYMQTFSYGLTLLIGLILTRIKIGEIRFQFNKILSLTILKRSFPFALLILLMMLYTRIDSVMVERMLPNGKEQAGIYAQGFRLLDAVNMFAFLVAGLLLPIFSRIISEKKSIVPLFQMAGKLLIGVAVVVSVGIAIHAKPVISLIYKHNIEESSRIFFWLILSFIPLAFSHVFSTLLTANHSLKKLNLMAVAGIATNIGLNFILIPRMESEGAAIATLITQSVTAFLQVILVLKEFRLSIQWKLLAWFTIFSVIYTSTAYYIHDFYPHVLGMITTFLLGGTLLFMFRLINIKEVVHMIREKVKPSQNNS